MAGRRRCACTTAGLEVPSSDSPRARSSQTTEAMLKLGRHEEARVCATGALECNPVDHKARFRRARALLGNGGFEELALAAEDVKQIKADGGTLGAAEAALLKTAQGPLLSLPAAGGGVEVPAALPRAPASEERHRRAQRPTRKSMPLPILRRRWHVPRRSRRRRERQMTVARAPRVRATEAVRLHPRPPLPPLPQAHSLPLRKSPPGRKMSATAAPTPAAAAATVAAAAARGPHGPRSFQTPL